MNSVPDILTIQQGDFVEYQPYRCSPNLEATRSTGIYHSFTFWSPDERPVELWLEITGLSEPGKGLTKRIRSSQVTNVYRQA